MENTSLSDALISLIPTYGRRIIFGIVALESAGVPLPGETILVAAALLAATTGQISIVVVVLASAGGAIVGDGVGYMVGRRFGLPLIRRYGRMAAHGGKADVHRKANVRKTPTRDIARLPRGRAPRKRRAREPTHMR